jgi:hypothetical protein
VHFHTLHTHYTTDILQSAALTVLCLTYYCGLLIISDVTRSDGYNASLFNGFIMLVNGALLFVVIPVTFALQFRMLSKSLRKMLSSLTPAARAAKRSAKQQAQLNSAHRNSGSSKSPLASPTTPATARAPLLTTVYEFPSPDASPVNANRGRASKAIDNSSSGTAGTAAAGGAVSSAAGVHNLIVFKEGDVKRSKDAANSSSAHSSVEGNTTSDDFLSLRSPPKTRGVRALSAATVVPTADDNDAKHNGSSSNGGAAL